MRIGIYDILWGDLIGGGEYYVGAIAEALARDHDVTIVHHSDKIPHVRTAEAFGLDLSGVEYRRVPPIGPVPRAGLDPLRHYRVAAQHGADLSRSYDLFLFSGGLTPPCFGHGRRNAMLVHFPFSAFEAHHQHEGQAVSPLERLKRRYHRLVWDRRMGSYDLMIANSEFTQGWLRRRWFVDSTVVYPPVRTAFAARTKEPTILALGRLVPDKRADVLIETFRGLCDAGLEGWRLELVGGAGDTDEGRRFLETLRQAAAGYPVELAINVPGAELTRRLEAASIFWHAKGYGVDHETHPEELEHFGIATAEAMAAGCVPVVYAGGGQIEIVRDGVDGFHWRTLDELADRTRKLTADETLRRTLSEAARDRAARFSKDACARRVREVLSPLLSS